MQKKKQRRDMEPHKWMHCHGSECHTQSTSIPSSIQFLFHCVSLEVFCYSKVVLVAIQLVYQLSKQWTRRCPCFHFVFYYNALEIKLYSLFPFPLWGLTFKCISTDQSPKPDNTNISFLAICREITCTTILERENEIYNEAVIQSLSHICQGLDSYLNPFSLVLR